MARKLSPFAFVALLAAATSACTDTEGVASDVAHSTELTKEAFFSHDDLYYVRVEGWDPALMTPESLAEDQSVAGAVLRIYRTKATSPSHCPDGEGELVYETDEFEIRTSGNFTKGTPKSSYKLSLTGPKNERFLGMKKLNLKSMWNDVSQMREALAWELFDKAQIPASGHSYARFCINERYYGLYSVIEQVDKRMLKDHFGKLDEGNLYKAYWSNEDIGPADLTYRTEDGSDAGAAYWKTDDLDARTYELKSNEDEPELASYDDLATLVRILNGKTLADGEDFDSPAFRQDLEEVFDARAFLRWASVNTLLGAWDNYWATPANYYLYNAGREEDGDFVAEPYFTFVPWDYDHSFGIDYVGTPWHAVGILDWAKHTQTESKQLPLVTNLLSNDAYLAYYLDHMECMLDHYFNTSWVEAQIGDEEGQEGLWSLIRASVYLESDSPQGAPHTGRQFSNDQVYWNGYRHEQLWHGAAYSMGIWHHVNARHDSARSQIAWLRDERQLPKASEPVCLTPE